MQLDEFTGDSVLASSRASTAGSSKKTLTLLQTRMDSLEDARAKGSHLAELPGLLDLHVKASQVLLPC